MFCVRLRCRAVLSYNVHLFFFPQVHGVFTSEAKHRALKFNRRWLPVRPFINTAAAVALRLAFTKTN